MTNPTPQTIDREALLAFVQKQRDFACFSAPLDEVKTWDALLALLSAPAEAQDSAMLRDAALALLLNARPHGERESIVSNVRVNALGVAMQPEALASTPAPLPVSDAYVAERDVEEEPKDEVNFLCIRYADESTESESIVAKIIATVRTAMQAGAAAQVGSGNIASGLTSMVHGGGPTRRVTRASSSRLASIAKRKQKRLPNSQGNQRVFAVRWLSPCHPRSSQPKREMRDETR